MACISVLFSNLCSETSKYNKIKSDRRTDTYFKNLLKIKSEQNRIYISSLNNLSPDTKIPDQSVSLLSSLIYKLGPVWGASHSLPGPATELVSTTTNIHFSYTTCFHFCVCYFGRHCTKDWTCSHPCCRYLEIFGTVEKYFSSIYQVCSCSIHHNTRIPL